MLLEKMQQLGRKYGSLCDQILCLKKEKYN